MVGVLMRFIQAAMTPIQFEDIYHALAQHIANKGLDEFRQAITSYLDVKRAYTFTSFMRAIYACLISLKKIDRREEVIIPRYSCPTFAHAILASGLRTKYCDVSPTTLSFDMNYLYKMNLRNVLAIICVNHLGSTNPVDEIADLCKRNSIYLIEDLGYALGSEHENRKLGTFGDFSVLNFQEGKAIPIGGGMVTTSHEDIMDGFNTSSRAKQQANILTMVGHKFLSNPHPYLLFMRINKLLNYDMRRRFSMEDTIRHTAGEYDYTFSSNATLKCISNFQGTLGCSILSNMDKHMKIREKNASVLEAELRGLKSVSIIQKVPRISRVHYVRYPILVRRKLRSLILTELLNKGIEASPMYSEYAVSIDANKFPGAAKVLSEILALPCHPGVGEEDLKITVEVIKELS